MRFTAYFHETGRANARAQFPLTPALSLEEREQSSPRWGMTNGLGPVDELAGILPLLGGEGRGEGKRRAVTDMAHLISISYELKT